MKENEPVCNSESVPASGSTGDRSQGVSRRTFVLGAGGVAVLLGLGSVNLAEARSLVRPPGGQDEKRLISACLRCEKCYEMCPLDIIVPARLEDGFINMRTPTLDFSSNWCNWCADHNNGIPLCAEACPTGALSLPQGAQAADTLLGIAEITTNWCLAYKLSGCRFCFDACPYDAIELDEYARPHVIADKCNGCGACECACVSLKNGSITEGATSRAITVQALSQERGQ